MSMDSCLCIWAPSASGKDSAGKTVSDSLSRPGEQQVRKSSYEPLTYPDGLVSHPDEILALKLYGRVSKTSR